MLLNSVILILREVLEVAMLASILFSFLHIYHFSSRILWWIPVLGVPGLLIYVANIERITDALDGIGQEVLNASLQLTIYVLIVVFSAFIIAPKWRQRVGLCVVVAMSLAFIREGSEIVLYVMGFLSTPDGIAPVMIGSLIGLGIGTSVGILIYHFLISESVQTRGIWINFGFLFLTAGAMIMQVTHLLIQADKFPFQRAIWDSSGLLSENTMMGQLLYALVGYEATPSVSQVICYLVSILLVAGVTWRSYREGEGK